VVQVCALVHMVVCSTCTTHKSCVCMVHTVVVNFKNILKKTMKKFEIIDDNIIYKYQIYSGTRYHRGVVLHTFEGTCVHTPVHLNACILYLFVFRCTWVVTTIVQNFHWKREIIATKKTTKH